MGDTEAVEVVVSNPANDDTEALAKQKEANRQALAALLDEPEDTEKDKRFSEVSLGNNSVGQAPPEQLYREADAARAPSEAGNIELVEWIPNLPQLFLFIVMTQVFLVFIWFIAYCAEPKEKFGQAQPSFYAQNSDAFQATTWIFFLLMSLVFAVYMWFVKKSFLKTTVSVLFAMFVFLALFQAPLSTSDSAKAFSATFAFFRVLVLLLIGFLYTIAYREDIIPPRGHLPAKIRNFVVTHRLDQA